MIYFVVAIIIFIVVLAYNSDNKPPSYKEIKHLTIETNKHDFSNDLNTLIENGINNITNEFGYDSLITYDLLEQFLIGNRITSLNCADMYSKRYNIKKEDTINIINETYKTYTKTLLTNKNK